MVNLNKDKDTMPPEKDFEKTIPKLYRRKYEDIGMLFFVEAQKSIVPTITIEQALYSYFRFIGADNFDVKCARVTYSRLKAEFIDLKYETSKKTI